MMHPFTISSPLTFGYRSSPSPAYSTGPEPHGVTFRGLERSRPQDVIPQDVTKFSASQPPQDEILQELIVRLETRMKELPLPNVERNMLGELLKVLSQPSTGKPCTAFSKGTMTPRQTANALLGILTYYHPLSVEHSSRVRDFSLEIGRRMQLSEGEMEALEIAALLHDIGKLGICEELLDLKDRYNEKEDQRSQRHTDFGAHMIDALGFDNHLASVSAAVRAHHERWDGTGFPLGLKGTNIPKLAQIIAVADVADALWSERSYKKRLAFPLFLQTMAQKRGTHFNPDILDCFYQSPIHSLSRIMNRDTIHIKPKARMQLKRILSPLPPKLSLQDFGKIYAKSEASRSKKENRMVQAFDTAYHQMSVSDFDPHGMTPREVTGGQQEHPMRGRQKAKPSQKVVPATPGNLLLLA